MANGTLPEELSNLDYLNFHRDMLLGDLRSIDARIFDHLRLTFQNYLIGALSNFVSPDNWRSAVKSASILLRDEISGMRKKGLL